MTERDGNTKSDFAARGSQRWLQIIVNQRPELVNEPLRRVMGLGLDEAITWVSPLAADACREYRDGEALRRVGIGGLSTRPLKDFWPQRGPVWDGLARTASGRSVFVEAKAHIAEAASPGTRAGDTSRGLIVASLEEARRFYAPRATSEWSGTFYQYANRLAHHYLLRVANGLPCALVFCYFINATDVEGPSSADEWRGAIKLLHAALGLPSNLEQHGVYDVFVDVRNLS